MALAPGVLKACPTKVLKPHEGVIKRCMVYALENPESNDVDEDIIDMADKLIIRPTAGSFIECTRCLDVCPSAIRQRGNLLRLKSVEPPSIHRPL